MRLTLPTILTLLRIVLIPVLVLLFYQDWRWANQAAALVFAAAAITDWLDGFLARRMGTFTTFGAFLDPVADKLMVATALIILVHAKGELLIALAAAVIIGREITVSALREWMSELGQRAAVKVSVIGKSKTTFQMIAIGLLLYTSDIGPLPTEFIGEWCLYLAAVLTIWSMLVYLRSAWPYMRGS